ncbi:MAG TPA: hypothetical protein DCM41_04895, partial [Synergistaceae bacterium]|nr:hypothetical protein [Synergistaceae bacterium]
DPNESNSALHAMLGRGISVERLTESLFAVFRDLWVFSLWGEKGMEALEISEEEGKFLREETPHWNSEKLRSACLFCNSLLPRARYGMRMEVFSGLIMLELLNIIKGENDALSSVPEVNKPQERILSSETVQPRPDRLVRQTEPAANDHKPVSARAAYIPPVQTTEAASFEELPDGNYAKLLSKLGNRGIAIGAALLNCGIQIEDSEWKLDTDVHSPSLTYLMVPQNRKLLSKALEELWGTVDPAVKENAAAMPENLSVENRVGEDSSNIREKAQKGSLISDTDRIIKLLGAEVLYVKDANGDNETDDFGSID